MTFWRPQFRNSILYRLVGAVQAEYATALAEADGLKHLLDADRCDSRYFNAVVDMLAGALEPDWSDAKKRQALKALVATWMVKGTKMGADAVLRMRSFDDLLPVELWKRILHEVSDYSDVRDYYRTRAARVRFQDDEGTPASRLDAATREQALRTMLPIHVLVNKTQHGEYALVDASLYDGISEDVAFGESAEPDPDAQAGLGISMAVQMVCVATCQSACQTAVEAVCSSCETSCEAYCETVCQQFDQVPDLEEPEACAMGCESTCETGEEIACGGPCETDCQTVAEYT